ncbi:MAG TPA: TerC/Alx family metal homeostasis membrane protein [Chitinophagaceae bacterium]|jgi:tellurite resistance protein TerC|nr:MAG: Inner membrane protein alx [Bacteroidetes bacterium ADurb.BinA245]HMW66510.1 TerC/Alx family metal homeostasis membrane protein [Chitinophagaceae bacterium]HMX76805.1 TerC/Alx family metal homeostasis membrane protein [Chitinophagaceae bacterium]HNA18704.1 TerC/Alx family metal homeostasis membrane protein [Chitinophagaceae bacterium]HNA91997.1 TerC/Alx family metal homeostasis membrane protein [Chitinophagaceae bacterium]
MTTEQITYIVFGGVLILALIFDLGLLSKKGKKVTIRQALFQTFFWVGLALGFFVFMWIENGQSLALQYLSGYLMEWSLSIDNIFVFILIFSAFSVKEKYFSRVLLIGILMAIVFRIIFITVGVALVEKFHWILYVFGVFLVYTGYKMFTATDDEEFNPQDSKIYKFLKRFLPLVPHDGEGRYRIVENGKPVYTTLFVVVIMLAAIDLVFALDSIPAVMGISQDKLVIYTSNIFAVLGLRSLFFLLRGAVSKFDYLQQGIAIVLVFIGLKMLCEKWISQVLDKNTQVFISLGVIMICISGSIFYSIFMHKKGLPPEVKE